MSNCPRVHKRDRVTKEAKRRTSKANESAKPHSITSNSLRPAPPQNISALMHKTLLHSIEGFLPLVQDGVVCIDFGVKACKKFHLGTSKGKNLGS